MAIQFQQEYLRQLKESFKRGRLTFYLGAGVSKPSGLPNWDEFVQALYFSTLQDESLVNELSPYPNYLFAIAEWVLEQKNEPLDIVIRKIKQWYEGRDFIGKMSNTLYAGFGRENFGTSTHGLSEHLTANNETLNAIINCCLKSKPGHKGLKSIITYNYDNLVELALEKYSDHKEKFQVIYKAGSIDSNKIPIYHVHGYIPYQDNNISYDDIIFSEEQYNRAFQDSYYWGNTVQTNHLTSCTGLMIGLSLSDRNTRRILDSMRNQPLPLENFILMRNPQFSKIDNEKDLKNIREKAEAYLNKFPGGRMKMPEKEPTQIKQILEKVHQYERTEFKKGFESLGLKLITFDEYHEIPEILEKIISD